MASPTPVVPAQPSLPATRTAALMAHPAFAGEDEAYVAEWGPRAAAFLTGREATAFDNASAQEILSALAQPQEAATGTVRERVRQAQQGLQYFGLPRGASEVDGKPGTRTRNALSNAMTIFGPVLGNQPAAVVANLRGFGSIMDDAARATGRPGVPERVGARDLQQIVRDYQTLLIGQGRLPAGHTTGVFDAPTLEAYRAWSTAGRPGAVPVQSGGARRPTSGVTPRDRGAPDPRPGTSSRPPNGTSGGTGGTTSAPGAGGPTAQEALRLTVATNAFQSGLQNMSRGIARTDAVAVARALQQMATLSSQNVQGASQALTVSNTALVSSLNTPQRLADFIAAAGSMLPEDTRTLLYERIVRGYNREQRATLRTALAMHDFASAGVLDSTPLSILDAIDDEGSVSNTLDRRVVDAVLRRKNVQALLREDLDDLLRGPPEVVGRRLAELGPEHADALRTLTLRLAQQINADDDAQRGAAVLILNVLDHNPQVAGEMLTQIYRQLDDTEKDDFAMVLAQPRPGRGETVRLVGENRTYDQAVARLPQGVKDSIAYHLYLDVGWYVYDDAERALAYHLRGETEATDRYGRHTGPLGFLGLGSP